MKRITKKQKEIATAHLQAAKNGTFTFDAGITFVWTIEQFKSALMQSQTCEAIHHYIEVNHVSVTSQLMAHPDIFGHIGDSYRKQYLAGFKSFLNRQNIQ